MAGSVEFGVLEEWSDVSLIPEYRVDLSDAEFEQISPMFARVSAETGIEFDLYTHATISGSSLQSLIAEIINAVPTTQGTAQHALEALARSARHALVLGRPLQFRGL